MDLGARAVLEERRNAVTGIDPDAVIGQRRRSPETAGVHARERLLHLGPFIDGVGAHRKVDIPRDRDPQIPDNPAREAERNAQRRDAELRLVGPLVEHPGHDQPVLAHERQRGIRQAVVVDRIAQAGRDAEAVPASQRKAHARERRGEVEGLVVAQVEEGLRADGIGSVTDMRHEVETPLRTGEHGYREARRARLRGAVAERRLARKTREGDAEARHLEHHLVSPGRAVQGDQIGVDPVEAFEAVGRQRPGITSCRPQTFLISKNQSSLI